MTTSQILMFAALGFIAAAWAGAWLRGHRSSALHGVFASLFVQAAAAVSLSFSSGSLPLSLTLSAIILAAVGWMIRSGARFSAQRLASAPSA